MIFMGVRSSIAKERNRDRVLEMLDAFHEELGKMCDDLTVLQERQLKKLEILLETQQQTLLRFEEILCAIQHKLPSQGISSSAESVVGENTVDEEQYDSDYTL